MAYTCAPFLKVNRKNSTPVSNLPFLPKPSVGAGAPSKLKLFSNTAIYPDCVLMMGTLSLMTFLFRCYPRRYSRVWSTTLRQQHSSQWSLLKYISKCPILPNRFATYHHKRDNPFRSGY